MKKYKLIIFDLDGTLVNTSEGIFNSVRYAVEKMGLNNLSEEKLRMFIGPPPTSMYMKMFNLDEETAKMATTYHREYSKTKAIYEAVLYPEIKELLVNLKNKGYKLAVATLKSEEIANKVLRLCGIESYFDIVAGMDNSESYTKAQIIKRVVNLLSDTNSSLMIGDTLYDKEGAEEAKVDFLGVSYGFGFRGNKYCAKPSEIVNYLK